MHSFNIFVIAGPVFALSLYTTLAAPSPSHVSSTSSNSPGLVRPAMQSHHSVKAAKKVGHKRFSRRSPFHPDILMARSNTGPLATATQLLNAASFMNDDKDMIHQALKSMQANNQIARNTEFQKEVSAKLKQWQKHAKSIPTLTNIHNSLRYFGRDQGMANLNKNNEMEVALKNTINSMKYSMSDINLMAYQVPAMGRTLGPIVYQIKCILDDILNGSENTSDALLNKLGLGKRLDLCSLMSNLKEFC